MVKESQYEVLHHFTRKLYEAGLRAGYKCRLLIGDEMWTVPERDPPELTIGFNGGPRTKEGDLFCDLLQIPHLALLVDPPYRFLYVLTSPRTKIGCDDRIGCRMLHSLDFHSTFFLPHAVEPELAPDPSMKKLFDVVMMMTFIPFKELRQGWKNKFPPLICKLMDETVERTFTDPTHSFIEIFDDLLTEAQQKYPPEVFADVTLSKVLEEIEMYIKGRDRFALATSIKNTNVHIFGAQDAVLKHYLGNKHPNLFVHPSVSFQNAMEIFKQTKILLNPNLKNKEGAHERIFVGLACGAAVITNPSAYLDETFTENQDILYYRHGELNRVDELLSALLADEGKRSELVKRGHTVVLQHHTWDHRMAEICKNYPD